VNSLRAAHAVDASNIRLGERIACLVIPRGGHDEPKLLELLERSSAEFGGYQLWYQRPERRGQAAKTLERAVSCKT